ncbi:MAG: hypothetical protein EA397_04815 [Deltaproteobacteria bacterium]|nr:MAG: hypothetical protein EA397_04815 [Deltaproteobacteria bacterium]
MSGQLSADELGLLLLDPTSWYFESDLDDVERANLAEEWDGDGEPPSMPRPQVVNEPPLRMRGHSKDHRPDKPQVVIGMVGTRGGRLLSAQVYAGNRSDQTITCDLLARVHRQDGGRPEVEVPSERDPPMHHRAARRIRAHVLMCAMALACLQELEHRTGRRFTELAKLFGSV